MFTLQSEDLGLDRQIEEMTTMMDNAIRSDIEMNKIRKPALNKTQILNRVIAVLQKYVLLIVSQDMNRPDPFSRITFSVLRCSSRSWRVTISFRR